MGIYKNVWGSIASWTSDLVDEAVINGLSTDLQFFDWDNVPNVHELPLTDLLGPAATSISVEEQIYVVDISLGLAMHSDNGLFRHRAILDLIFEKVLPSRTINYYDADTAQKIGELTFTAGTSILPMSDSENHSLQWVQAEALLVLD